MVFSGELLAHKCSKIRSSEAINFSLTKFKKLNSIHLRIDNMTALSYLLNTGGTLKKHLIEISKKNLALFHREESTFDSRIYTQSEQSNSRLGIPKLPGQQQMVTLPNCVDLFASRLFH